MNCRILPAVVLACVLVVPGVLSASETRESALARAQVWMATDIPAMDIMNGPDREDGFSFQEVVHCDYLDEELGGMSPKFACETSDADELKVKYGGDNGEVYGEVAASRLLWALGFGADHMYPVRIVCRGCPGLHGSILRVDGESRVFDPASVERKMPGKEISDYWAWPELDGVDEEAGGAPLAHRDALKLLAVFLQHSDNKPEQQRLICLDKTDKDAKDAECARPFMLVQDVGLTFGRATRSSNNNTTGMNLTGWSGTPVWMEGERCVGHLQKSLRGTLHQPGISEEGRAFLAGLLVQLTDRQIRDLFEVSRVTLRVRTPSDARSGFPTVDEWVAAFKARRDQIVNRRCA